MGIPENILRGIYNFGYDTPSDIQARAISPILNQDNVLVQSQSGTGKTAVFCIGALAKALSQKTSPSVIILSPTRELAEQSCTVCKNLSEYIKDIEVKAIVGGTSMSDNHVSMSSGVNIISGTPGRIDHLIRSRIIASPENVGMLILDECDEMLNKGFKEQVLSIYEKLNSKRLQIVLVSATLPNEIRSISQKLMGEKFISILVPRDELSLAKIKQYYIYLDLADKKFENLVNLYDSLTIVQSVIFCNTRAKVEQLGLKLTKNLGLACLTMHGQMSQTDRSKVLADFKSGRHSRVLITTDVWGRGIDVSQVSLVVCYDIPSSKDAYLHRIGRSGRFGRKGIAINFVVSQDDKQLIRSFEDYYSISINPLPSDIGSLAY